MKKQRLLSTATLKEARPFPDARENGSLGGQQRAILYGPGTRSEWATMGGVAVFNKYGPEHFREIRELRKNYPKQDAQDRARNVISPRIISARENGKRGGLARAKLHRPEELTTWARAGGRATRERYGKDYYREIRKLRTEYPKGYITRKTKTKQKALYSRLAKSADPMSAFWRFLANRTE